MCIQIGLSFPICNLVACYLVLACSLIACRNYPSGLVDRAPQDCVQPLELVYQSLRRILGRLLLGREHLSSSDRTYPLSSKDQATRVLINRPPRPTVELTRAQPSGRSGPRLLAAWWGKEGGRHGYSTLPSTEAWKAARRRCTSGGTLARKGDGVGTVGTKRRRGLGVGIFTEGGAAFYRAKARWGRPGAFNGQR
jgi:hypothetical protein